MHSSARRLGLHAAERSRLPIRSSEGQKTRIHCGHALRVQSLRWSHLRTSPSFAVPSSSEGPSKLGYPFDTTKYPASGPRSIEGQMTAPLQCSPRPDFSTVRIQAPCPPGPRDRRFPPPRERTQASLGRALCPRARTAGARLLSSWRGGPAGQRIRLEPINYKEIATAEQKPCRAVCPSPLHCICEARLRIMV